MSSGYFDTSNCASPASLGKGGPPGPASSAKTVRMAGIKRTPADRARIFSVGVLLDIIKSLLESEFGLHRHAAAFRLPGGRVRIDDVLFRIGAVLHKRLEVGRKEMRQLRGE